MSFYTDWFLADQSEAEAIASIATDETHSHDDWPHLAMKDVGEMELMRLWVVLRDGERLVAASKVVFMPYEGGGPVVTRLDADFVAALAGLEKPDVDRVATAWHATPEMARWEVATVASRLCEMAEFARRARREGKPILQLHVW